MFVLDLATSSAMPVMDCPGLICTKTYTEKFCPGVTLMKGLSASVGFEVGENQTVDARPGVTSTAMKRTARAERPVAAFTE